MSKYHTRMYGTKTRWQPKYTSECTLVKGRVIEHADNCRFPRKQMVEGGELGEGKQGKKGHGRGWTKSILLGSLFVVRGLYIYMCGKINVPSGPLLFFTCASLFVVVAYPRTGLAASRKERDERRRASTRDTQMKKKKVCQLFFRIGCKNEKSTYWRSTS
jgi:hypothetical protein